MTNRIIFEWDIIGLLFLLRPYHTQFLKQKKFSSIKFITNSFESLFFSVLSQYQRCLLLTHIGKSCLDLGSIGIYHCFAITWTCICLVSPIIHCPRFGSRCIKQLLFFQEHWHRDLSGGICNSFRSIDVLYLYLQRRPKGSSWWSTCQCKFKTHDLQHWELFKTFVGFDKLNLFLGRTLLDPSLAEKHYHSWTPKQRQRPLGQSRQVPWRWNQWYQFKRLPWTLSRVWLRTKNR